MYILLVSHILVPGKNNPDLPVSPDRDLSQDSDPRGGVAVAGTGDGKSAIRAECRGVKCF